MRRRIELIIFCLVFGCVAYGIIYMILAAAENICK